MRTPIEIALFMLDQTVEYTAIDADTGEEVWGFIPPFIGSLLPQLINKGLMAKLMYQRLQKLMELR